MSIVSAIYLEDENKKKEDIQEFEGLPFKIKIIGLQDYKDVARLLFLDNNNNQMSIPPGIICKDITDGIDCGPFPDTQVFLVKFLHIYQITYNNAKLYQINCEKKIQIHNFKQTKEKIAERNKKREIKKEKETKELLDNL